MSAKVRNLMLSEHPEQWQILEGIQALGRTKGVPFLLRCLPELPPAAAWHAVGRTLPELGGKRVQRVLVRILRTHSDVRLREAAAYGLWQVGGDDAHYVLVASVSDRTEDPRVRGQAAETLGYITRDRRTRQYREVAHALIDALADASPIVRFWAAFALGSMRARQAVPALRHLATTDQEVCPGWWRVGDEAGDAVISIEGGTPPERRRSGGPTELNPGGRNLGR